MGLLTPPPRCLALFGATDEGSIEVARMDALRRGGRSAPCLVRVELDDERGILGLALRPCAAGVIAAVTGGRDVQRLAAMLAVAEAKSGLDPQSVAIVAEIASGAGLLAAGSLTGCSRRLAGVAWDGEAFARDIGAAAAREASGDWIGPCSLARATTLAVAAAAGTRAIDAVCSTLDADAFRREAETARRDGFAAKVARDRAQQAAVIAAFG